MDELNSKSAHSLGAINVDRDVDFTLCIVGK